MLAASRKRGCHSNSTGSFWRLQSRMDKRTAVGTACRRYSTLMAIDRRHATPRRGVNMLPQLAVSSCLSSATQAGV
jgi:hypothetical protein